MDNERAQRIGRSGARAPGNDGPKTRSIIVCFRDNKDVEIIMLNASRLKHKPQYGITRYYPSEIVQARFRLWSDFKRAKREGNVSVFIDFPAKLTINRHVVRDEFQELSNIKTSRITNPLHPRSNEIQVDANNMQPILSESTDTPLDEYNQAMAQLDSQIRNRNKETPQTRKAPVQQASATPNINTPPSPSQHAPSSKGTSNNPNHATPSTTTTPRTGKPSPTYGPTRSAPKGTSHKQRHKIR